MEVTVAMVDDRLVYRDLNGKVIEMPATTTVYHDIKTDRIMFCGPNGKMIYFVRT